MRNLFCAVLFAAALAATGALAQAVPAMTGDSAKGKVLTDHAGKTLYTFDKDADGKSMCNGPCAVNWPPVMATAADKPSGSYTIIKRDDGTMQWAYKGKPLYTWKNDAKAGDVTGDGMAGNTWHVATP